jgi:hypothetical protein
MIESTPEKVILLKIRKQQFGFSYGAAAGFAFAVALWGYDGALLSTAHGLFPWLKFLVGVILTTLTGGLAGWLTSRYEKILPGILFWAGASSLFAVYTNIVPLILAPRITGLLVPEINSRLLYTPFDNLPTLIGVAFGWNIIASVVSGILQIPMLEPALYSLSGFGRVKPHLLCAILMLISGGVADTLVNKPLRDPILGLDSTLQFIVDTRGQDVDKETSREKHLASFRLIDSSIQRERQLVVSRYDPLLENIFVLIHSGGGWSECPTFYGTPLTCQPITP